MSFVGYLNEQIIGSGVTVNLSTISLVPNQCHVRAEGEKSNNDKSSYPPSLYFCLFFAFFYIVLGKGPPPLLIYGTFSCALWPLTHADCRWQVGMAIVISSSSRGESPRRNWNKAISLESAKFKLFMDYNVAVFKQPRRPSPTSSYLSVIFRIWCDSLLFVDVNIPATDRLVSSNESPEKLIENNNKVRKKTAVINGVPSHLASKRRRGLANWGKSQRNIVSRLIIRRSATLNKERRLVLVVVVVVVKGRDQRPDQVLSSVFPRWNLSIGMALHWYPFAESNRIARHSDSVPQPTYDRLNGLFVVVSGHFGGWTTRSSTRCYIVREWVQWLAESRL